MAGAVSAIRSKNVRHADEQLLPAAGRGVADSEQEQEGRPDPTLLGWIRDVDFERLGDPGPGRPFVVRLAELGAPPDDLAEGPERDALAVGGRTAGMPADRLLQAVHVLVELPGEPALADPGLAGDRDEARLPFAGCGVIGVLHQAQLGVAADEGRLEALGPAGAAPFGDDPQGSPGWDRRGLALQQLIARGLEQDRPGSRSLGRLADQHGARRRDRLESAGGVDEITGDHPLARRPEGHRRLAGQDSGAQVELVVASRTAQLMNGRDQVKAGPDRSLGVVLERDRRAPNSHDGVADELLDRPTVALDHVPGGLEVGSQEFPDLLRIVTVGSGRESNEVGEQDAHQAALGGRREVAIARRGDRDRSVARRGAGSHRRGALQLIAALAAELRALGIRRAAIHA